MDKNQRERLRFSSRLASRKRKQLSNDGKNDATAASSETAETETLPRQQQHWPILGASYQQNDCGILPSE